jgi:hypothetical protein
MVKGDKPVVDDDAPPSRSYALPWMEEGVRRSVERKDAPRRVVATIVVIVLLLAVFVGLPLILVNVF